MHFPIRHLNSEIGEQIHGVTDRFGGDDFTSQMGKRLFHKLYLLFLRLQSILLFLFPSYVSFLSPYHVLIYEVIELLRSKSKKLPDFFGTSFFIIPHNENGAQVSKEVFGLLSPWFRN